MTMTLGQPPEETVAETVAGTRPSGRTGRLAAIDGLRLAAALSVALFHYTGCVVVGQAWGASTRHTFSTIYKFSSYGWLGVELFFLISGFVICMSSWGRTQGEFVRTRVVRLFPAYWPAVLITTVVMILWPVARHALPADQVIANLTMLNQPVGVPNVDDSYWTLWAEMRFYLVFAVALVWRGLTLHRTLLFGYGWLIAGILSIKSGVPLVRTVLEPDTAPLFVAGIAFYLIYRFGGNLQLWGLVGFAYALAMHNVVGRTGASSQSNYKDLSPITGMVILTVFFLVMAVIAKGWTARIQWRWLTTAGLLTYPFYLLHQVIGWSIIEALRDVRPRKLVLVAVIVLMLVAAWLLHRLIEKPLARVLKVKLAEASVAVREQRTRLPYGGGARPSAVPVLAQSADVENRGWEPSSNRPEAY